MISCAIEVTKEIGHNKKAIFVESDGGSHEELGIVVEERKIFSVEGQDGVKLEYRVWNPFRFKLAAGFLDGIDHIYIVPKSKILYLGTASVGFSSRSGFDLVNVAKKDVIFADVAQPDQASNRIDFTIDPTKVFAKEIKRLQEEHKSK
nr:7260_t:CDS:2 [Entrophospora candida]